MSKKASGFVPSTKYSHLPAGFYWIHSGNHDWVPAEWTGRAWWAFSVQRPCSDDEVNDPVRIQPPAPQAGAAEPDMRAICEALGFDPTNHHNAAKCPDCRPTEQPSQDAERKCNGDGCSAVDGVGHSAACVQEHERNVAGLNSPGNRNPEARYHGYCGDPCSCRYSADELAAWNEGRAARAAQAQGESSGGA